MHTMDLSRVELASAIVDGAAVTLGAWWKVSFGTAAVAVERSNWITVDSTTYALDDILNNWVVPLPDLLVTLLGHPVRIISLSIKPTSDSRPSEALRVLFGGLRTVGRRTWWSPSTSRAGVHPRSFSDPIFRCRWKVSLPMDGRLATIPSRDRPVLQLVYDPARVGGSLAEAGLRSLRTEHGFVRLRQHHHLGDKVSHDLEAVTLV